MKFGPQYFYLLLVAVAAITLACGSRGPLKSVSVTPATANADDYPAGQVQFTAFGYYDSSSAGVPTPVSGALVARPAGQPVSRSVLRGWVSANPERQALTL